MTGIWSRFRSAEPQETVSQKASQKETIPDVPKKSEMESMIEKANHVLKSASAPGVLGIPRYLFENCYGIVLISSFSLNVLVYGNVGTGIIISKVGGKHGDWSLPCACACTSTGWGMGIGLTVEDILVFIMDEVTMKSASSRLALSVSAQVGFTLGVGRNAGFSLGGKGGTVSIAYTKGISAGASLDGGVVAVRPGVNEEFYGKAVHASEILSGSSDVRLPAGKEHVMDEVYSKLRLLSAKAIKEFPSFDDTAKSSDYDGLDQTEDTDGSASISVKDEKPSKQRRKDDEEFCQLNHSSFLVQQRERSTSLLAEDYSSDESDIEDDFQPEKLISEILTDLKNGLGDESFENSNPEDTSDQDEKDSETALDGQHGVDAVTNIADETANDQLCTFDVHVINSDNAAVAEKSEVIDGEISTERC